MWKAHHTLRIFDPKRQFEDSLELSSENDPKHSKSKSYDCTLFGGCLDQHFFELGLECMGSNLHPSNATGICLSFRINECTWNAFELWFRCEPRRGGPQNRNLLQQYQNRIRHLLQLPDPQQEPAASSGDCYCMYAKTNDNFFLREIPSSSSSSASSSSSQRSTLMVPQVTACSDSSQYPHSQCEIEVGQTLVTSDSPSLSDCQPQSLFSDPLLCSGFNDSTLFSEAVDSPLSSLPTTERFPNELLCFSFNPSGSTLPFPAVHNQN